MPSPAAGNQYSSMPGGNSGASPPETTGFAAGAIASPGVAAFWPAISEPIWSRVSGPAR